MKHIAPPVGCVGLCTLQFFCGLYRGIERCVVRVAAVIAPVERGAVIAGERGPSAYSLR